MYYQEGFRKQTCHPREGATRSQTKQDSDFNLFEIAGTEREDDLMGKYYRWRYQRQSFLDEFMN